MNLSDKAIRPRFYTVAEHPDIAKRFKEANPAATEQQIVDHVAAWIGATVQEKVVDCPTCPVNMLCEAGEGGSGFACGQCDSTAMGVEDTNLAKTETIYYIDCAKQHFSRDAGVISQGCDLCSGKIMKTEVNGIPPTLYIIRTVYSKVPIDDRRRIFDARRQEYETHEKAKAENPDRVR